MLSLWSAAQNMKTVVCGTMVVAMVFPTEFPTASNCLAATLQGGGVVVVVVDQKRLVVPAVVFAEFAPGCSFHSPSKGEIRGKGTCASASTDPRQKPHTHIMYWRGGACQRR